ncbi:MAG: ABC transporter permease [Planctomycetota bacterium]|nr:ABC transporter permease [Planctomycetota bacterium]
MTFLLETIRLGLANLRLHVLRSVLTALGIILGVTAVITMVSIGEGSKRSALQQLEQLGAKNIIIRSVNPPQSIQQQSGQRRSWRARYGLTRQDLDNVRAAFPWAEAIVPTKDVGSQLLRENLRIQSQTFGTTPQFQQAANLRVARGRYLTQADLDDALDVAVLGHEVARKLFPFDDPLGNTFRIDAKVFTVVGVLAPVGLSGGAGAALVGRDLNLDAHIPLTTARIRFGDSVFRGGSGSFSAEDVQIREIYFTSASRETVLVDAAMLRRVMDTRQGGSKDIQMIIPYELLENAKRAALTWQLVLAAIAGISLLVGGIGIMNIMLASVTERTREIGIRRALGATQKHIIWQFLVETGVLSAVGGLIGVALGITLSILLGLGAQYFFEQATVSTQLTGWSIALSFSVATATGLIFGIYPALKAAKQDPIVALRHD